MSRIRDTFALNRNFHIEQFDSAMEVVETCRTRKMTNGSFNDMRDPSRYDKWNGVKSYDEALDFMKNGYQPTVESLRSAFKFNKQGEGTRFSFQNEIQGFAPVVPLALKNVPNSMMNVRMKPIKAKVVDVYYDMTVSCSIKSDDIIEAGRKLLASIISLEKQGYRFNLYAVQTYSDSNSCDMLTVRVKRDSQPLDLKRVSFPLTHTGFFRCIGFDWYSKVPGGTYRFGYGHGIAYEFKDARLKNMAKELFGNNAIYFSAAQIIDNDEEHIKEVLSNGKCEA